MTVQHRRIIIQVLLQHWFTIGRLTEVQIKGVRHATMPEHVKNDDFLLFRKVDNINLLMKSILAQAQAHHADTQLGFVLSLTCAFQGWSCAFPHGAARIAVVSDFAFDHGRVHQVG